METSSVAEQTARHIPNWQNRLMAGTTAAALVVVGIFAVREVKEEFVGCAPPSAAAVDAVERLINTPLPEFPGKTAPDRGAQMTKYEKAKQAELGITFPAYDPWKLHGLGSGLGGNTASTPPPF